MHRCYISLLHRSYSRITVIAPSHRYMNNPTLDGESYDWFPNRYIGPEDNGGVHWNSGIVNLAFVLMVQGGTHPRGLSSQIVPAIDSNFDKSLRAASRIFYKAQTSCLTPMAGFAEIRECTLMLAGEHAESVEAAWTAVGIGLLTFYEPISGLSSEESGWVDTGKTNIQPGKTVTCTTVGSIGDADLYVDMATISGSSGATVSCSSENPTSNESCTVGPMDAVSKIWVRVFAYTAFSDLTLTCTVDPQTPTRAPTKRPTRVPTKAPTKPPTKAPTKRPTKAPTRPTRPPTKKPAVACKPQGQKCKNTGQCCGKKITCDGPTSMTKKCKLALRAGAKCVRSTQCYQGYKCKAGKCVLAK